MKSKTTSSSRGDLFGLLNLLPCRFSAFLNCPSAWVPGEDIWATRFASKSPRRAVSKIELIFTSLSCHSLPNSCSRFELTHLKEEKILLTVFSGSEDVGVLSLSQGRSFKRVVPLPAQSLNLFASPSSLSRILQNRKSIANHSTESVHPYFDKLSKVFVLRKKGGAATKPRRGGCEQIASEPKRARERTASEKWGVGMRVVEESPRITMQCDEAGKRESEREGFGTRKG